MSYEAYETSRTKGEPVELYLFIYGPGATEFYAYCDGEQTVTLDLGAPHGIVNFVPLPIMRDSIKSSGTLDKAAMTITTERSAPIAELFRVYPPTQTVTCIIRAGHVGDPASQFLVVWSGRVLSCGFPDGSEATLTCEPIATSMRRAGLRRHYQYGCPHALYMGDENGGCRANKAAATVTSAVTAIAGSVLTVSNGWNGAFAAAKFRNGMVEWTTTGGAVERRTILAVSGNALTLSGIVRNLVVGGTVSIILGCDRMMDSDCKNLHNNVLDFGGQPFIPTKNPFGYYNNYY